MCTATFLPLPGGGYLLATNRDERPTRGEALPPAVRQVDGRGVLAPTDTDAGGTWIAADGWGRALCVLNGDRPPAAPVPDPALSRGLLLLELMASLANCAPGAAGEAVAQTLDRRLVRAGEPVKAFKLLVVEPGSAAGVDPPSASGSGAAGDGPGDGAGAGVTGSRGDPATTDAPRAQLTRLEWDGVALRRECTGDPALFVSSTFEPDAVEQRRSEAFEALASRAREARRGGHDALDAQASDPVHDLRAEQLAWHAGHAPGAAEGDAYSVCMHRGDAASRSLTALTVHGGAVDMAYLPGQPCAGAPLTHATLVAEAPRA